ncbi:MAG: bifunctional acetate--CoA ligase family protein/GNAT family N-acetyltransferase [Chromatiales bacterium]|nr:bifunctional acetate--CoA ligase family protein/GNAT family N-acetyltransferase [Chromatiales bacterium]
MGVRNLEKIFKPQRIALFGACEQGEDLGVSVLRNLLGGSYRGVVYPIHPSCESIHGIPTYGSLAMLPKVPDLGVICNPAAQVPEVVRQCGEAGVGGVLIISGGFRESGDSGRELERQIAEVQTRFPDMRIVGPNSLGIITPAIGLNASHSVATPKQGHLAFISESRALCNSVMDWAIEEGIGFSSFVSTGTRLDVGFGDLIDYFGKDPNTRAIILYIQSIAHARNFLSAARAFALSKPILVYKAGRFAETGHAVTCHTGAMVGEDAVYEAAFRRCGVVRVSELDDIFDVAEVLAAQRLPKGARMAIVSNAGGPAIIATDALLARGGKLAELSAETVAELDSILPPVGSHQNPVDILDGAPAERFARVLPPVLADAGVDGLLVIFAMQSGNDPAGSAVAVAEIAKKAKKPVLAAWMGGERVRKGIQILNEAGLPTHSTPEQGVRAFMHLVAYAHNLENLYRTPREVSVHLDLNRRRLRERLHPRLMEQREEITENHARSLLKAYGIPVCDSCTVGDPEAAVEMAEKLGFPVVLKVVSPQIVHKVDVGGVALGLEGPDDVRDAYRQMMEHTRSRCGEAVIKGVNVQKMVSAHQSIEIILGAKKDPTFGSIVMVGMGGIATGILDDRAIGLPPLNETRVRQMLESLRFWPMLSGYRGQPPVDVDQLIEVVMRFSMLIEDFPEIREFDINPLLASHERIVALDASMILDADFLPDPHDRHSHLAIRPYPQEYMRHAHAGDGSLITLRSVRAEDEPLWHDLIGKSSPESIRFRFRSMFRRATHRMAIDHCVIDHERQISIVAETEVHGQRELAGVAQLMADPNHESAEFAVLIPDPWQGKKLGGILLDYCLELAQQWGLRRVEAETDPDNRRMLETFRKRGFRAEVNREEEVVLLELDLPTR